MQTAGYRLDRGERYKSISILLSLSSPTSQRCFLVLVAGGESTSMLMVESGWKGVVVVTVVKMTLLLWEHLPSRMVVAGLH